MNGIMNAMRQYERHQMAARRLSPVKEYVTPSGSIDPVYHFQSFVHFGSATERLKNFDTKEES